LLCCALPRAIAHYSHQNPQGWVGERGWARSLGVQVYVRLLVAVLRVPVRALAMVVAEGVAGGCMGVSPPPLVSESRHTPWWKARHKYKRQFALGTLINYLCCTPARPPPSSPALAGGRKLTGRQRVRLVSC
jgi:hypothetical protein